MHLAQPVDVHPRKAPPRLASEVHLFDAARHWLAELGETVATAADDLVRCYRIVEAFAVVLARR